MFLYVVAEKEGDYLIYAQGYKLMKIASESDTGEHGQQLLYIPGIIHLAEIFFKSICM